LTDFGDGSVYVGAMKGVIAAICPTANVIDITHGVEPQCVEEAAFLLASAYRFFPPATTFACVVDPGVGSAREIALVEAAGRRFLAPDNGLLGGVLARETPTLARHVRERRFFLPEVSSTFHGRDIFAPVAARLAAGEIAPEAVGPAVDPARLVRIAPARPERSEAESKGAIGRVVHVDRFGNLVTDVAPPAAGAAPRAVEVGGRRIERFARTYAEAPAGEPFTYIGSFGTVEVALPSRSAAQALGVGRGAPVRVQFEEAKTE
jgi:S-adenosylmethionine hydrolase